MGAIMDWTKLTLQDGKHLKAVPCVDLVAFSSEPPTQSGPGFERFMRAFTNRYGDQLTFYRTGDMKRFRRFEERALDGPSHWFSDASLLATKMLGFEAHAGDSQHNIHPPAIYFMLTGLWEPPSFEFRMTLPIGAEIEPDDLVSLSQDALAEFPLQNGYCGYSFLWNETDFSLERDVCHWAAPLLLRHPGLNYGDVSMVSNAVHAGVVVVSWLTFLGKAPTDDLGGRDDLQQRCPDDVSPLPLDAGGCILRAGAMPALGDVNRGDLLPAHQAVGRLVAPRRADDEALENVVVEGMAEETANEWLRRFFE